MTRPRGKTFADLWKAYVADRQGRAILVTMQHTWKALADRFGPMDGDHITIADCRAHMEGRRRFGIKDGTLLTELGHLRTVLRWAEKHGLILRAPYIERPSAPKPQGRHLTREQVRALIQACDLPHEAGGKLFAYQSGDLIVGYSYGYFAARDLVRMGACLTVVEFLALLLLVPFYWPLSALNEIGWKRGDALTRFD